MPCAGGEADDEQPALRRQRAQRVREDRPADDVHHDVDAAAVGQRGDRVLEAVEEYDVVGAGRARDLALLVGADHGDGAGAEAAGDLDRRGADTAGRAVHQHRLARPQPAALGEREVGGQVVHRDRRARVERHGVGQPEREHRGDGHQLRGTAVGQHAGHPVAGREPVRTAERPSRRSRRRG